MELVGWLVFNLLCGYCVVASAVRDDTILTFLKNTTLHRSIFLFNILKLFQIKTADLNEVAYMLYNVRTFARFAVFMKLDKTLFLRKERPLHAGYCRTAVSRSGSLKSATNSLSFTSSSVHLSLPQTHYLLPVPLFT
jgi:hypothetical protein